MFTGLVEEIGVISGINRIGSGLRLSISCKKILNHLKIDDSVAINGACQTVTKLNDKGFEVDSIEETIRKSNLGSLRIGNEVNLERALKIGDRLGGHFVQGHVDCTGRITNIANETLAVNYSISFPNQFKKFILDSGSITINGVSLTTAKVYSDYFTVSLIPHSIKNTTFKNLKIGDLINLEFDILGKYIHNLINDNHQNPKNHLDQFIDQPDF